MLPEINSLFGGHEEGNGEVVTPLLSGGGFRLEHITSYGAATSDDSVWVAIHFDQVEKNAGD